MLKILVSLFIALITISKHGNANVKFVHSLEDYYWRDYKGYIPYDAVPGGLDDNNNTTYLGQLLITKGGNQQGLQPVAIYKGQKSVTASRYGILTSDKFIKILCSPHPENFYWESAKAETLHFTTKGKHLVEAGVEADKLVNYGRIQYQGELIVGKVCSYDIGGALMYFPYDGVEHSVKSYQVLVYKEKSDRHPCVEISKLQ